MIVARFRRTLARLLTYATYRLWPDFAPRVTGLSFAFEKYRGMVVYGTEGIQCYPDPRLGVRLMYVPDEYISRTPTDEYVRAHEPLGPGAYSCEVGVVGGVSHYTRGRRPGETGHPIWRPGVFTRWQRDLVHEFLRSQRSTR